MFNIFKKAATDQLNKYSGNKDFLEAVCATAALVASADGEIEEGEVKAAIASVKGNETLTKLYTEADIDSALDVQLGRAKTFSGRAKLWRELEDVAAKDATLRQDVFLAGVDVAHGDGELEPEERKVLVQVAQKLGVSPAIAGL